MVGSPATSVRLPVLLLLVSLANAAFFVVSGEFPSMAVVDFASLQLSPSLVVEGSPGSQVICERVEINGLSRLRNLTSFFSSVKVKVKVLNVNSTGRPPNITVCFHRNASLGLGMCPEGQWERLTKGSWVRLMSPFDQKLLDIRITGSSIGTIDVVLDKEFYLYRLIFLVLGVTLMTFASSLSNSLVIYYGGAMILGVMLVVLVVLFQGMRSLPSGRKSSLVLALYGSVVGIGSFLCSYIPALLRSLLLEMGIGEDVYSHVAVFLVGCGVVCGAWLGFWAVGKLVLREDGTIDTGVAQFVAWSLRIVASTLILQSSVDPLLAVEALMCGVVVPSTWITYVHKRRRRRRSKDKAVVDCDERLSDSNTFYSSFHKTPGRKGYSKDEWEEFTKESTKKALERLVCSPDFSRWAVAHADTITLVPKKETTRTRTWFAF